MKRLIPFLLGVTFGVGVTIVAKLYNDILSKQPEVKTWRMSDRLDNFANQELVKSLVKTQPVYVGEPEEVGSCELEQWAKEAE